MQGDIPQGYETYGEVMYGYICSLYNPWVGRFLFSLTKISLESMRLLYNDNEPNEHNLHLTMELERFHNNNTKPDCTL
jgi:hypothetical protein